MKYSWSTLTLFMFLLICSFTYAVDIDIPTAVTGGEGERANKLSGDGSVGYSTTSGNTESDSLNARFSLRHEHGQWTHSVKLTALNMSANDNTFAERYLLSQGNRYRFRGKHEKFYGYGGLRYDKDRFSGFDYQSSAAVGIGWNALRLERHLLDFRFGVGYRHAEDIFEERTEEGLFQGGTLYTFILSKNATFDQEILIEAGESNTVVESISSLKVGITSQIFVELMHTVKNNSDPPAGSASANRVSSVNFTYQF